MGDYSALTTIITSKTSVRNGYTYARRRCYKKKKVTKDNVHSIILGNTPVRNGQYTFYSSSQNTIYPTSLVILSNTILRGRFYA